MFYIRADANSEIGSGHVMRCLSLARAYRQRGIETTFITADRESEKLIAGYNFQMICLDSVWNDLKAEIHKLVNIIEERKIDQIMVDSYFVTEEYLRQLGCYTKIIYLDDLSEFIYPVNILINYNIYAEKIIEKELYRNYGTKLLLGCKYTPLREEFRDKKRIPREYVSDIMITTGGADTYNMSGNLLEFLNNKDYENITFHVVVGSFHQHREYLEALEKKFHNVILYNNVTEMSKLMLMCDIAISAGGSTLYELCSCSLPTISFSYADNQQMAVREFHRQDIIFYAGDARDDLRKCLNNIENRLKLMRSSFALRKELAERMGALVDGLGVQRIMDEIQNQ